MTARYRLTHAAQADIISILAWSHDQFGEEARKRYEALITTPSETQPAQATRRAGATVLSSGTRLHLASGAESLSLARWKCLPTSTPADLPARR